MAMQRRNLTLPQTDTTGQKMRTNRYLVYDCHEETYQLDAFFYSVNDQGDLILYLHEDERLATFARGKWDAIILQPNHPPTENAV